MDEVWEGVIRRFTEYSKENSPFDDNFLGLLKLSIILQTDPYLKHVQPNISVGQLTLSISNQHTYIGVLYEHPLYLINFSDGSPKEQDDYIVAEAEDVVQMIHKCIVRLYTYIA